MRPAPKMCIRGVTQPKSVNQLRNKFPACQSLLFPLLGRLRCISTQPILKSQSEIYRHLSSTRSYAKNPCVTPFFCQTAMFLPFCLLLHWQLSIQSTLSSLSLPIPTRSSTPIEFSQKRKDLLAHSSRIHTFAIVRVQQNQRHQPRKRGCASDLSP